MTNQKLVDVDRGQEWNSTVFFNVLSGTVNSSVQCLLVSLSASRILVWSNVDLRLKKQKNKHGNKARNDPTKYMSIILDDKQYRQDICWFDMINIP